MTFIAMNSRSGCLTARAPFSGCRIQHATSRGAVSSTNRSLPVRALKAADHVQLGDSDLHVSKCCLGTMTWGNQNTEEEAHEQLNYAFDTAGLNFLDTAEMYPVPPKKELQGRTDQYIGSWLAGRKRQDVILASKVSGYGERTGYTRDNDSVTRITPAQIEESVNKSLARLGTDYIDLLQIHWPDRYVQLFGEAMYDINQVRSDDVPFEEQLRGLENVVKAGKVRYIGVSNETSWGVCQFHAAAKAHGLPKVQTIQNSYSLVYRGAFETDLAETCASHNANVSLLAYSPLAGGSLTGKYQDGGNSTSRFNLFPGYMERFNKSLARQAVAEYVKVADKHGLTPSELALAWCDSRWFVASTIIGATSLDQLKENIGAFDKELSAEALEDVEKVYRKRKDPSVRDVSDD